MKDYNSKQTGRHNTGNGYWAVLLCPGAIQARANVVVASNSYLASHRFLAGSPPSKHKYDNHRLATYSKVKQNSLLAS